MGGMRVVVQRVARAAVVADGARSGEIGAGLVVFAAWTPDDTAEDEEWVLARLLKLRIFDDEHGAMAMSAPEVGAGLLVVSQFTLLASTKKGARPSWHRAAPPDAARLFYERFLERARAVWPGTVAAGVFGAMMQVDLVNDGPVTLVLDSRLRE